MQLSLVAPPTALTVELITKRTTDFAIDHSELHKRMDEDQARFELKPYNANVDGTNTFPSYTSNAPRTYAKKIVSLLASAEIFAKIPYGIAQAAERAKYDVKERFCYGLLASADERLMKRLQIRLKPQLVWYGALRGYICLRRVLVKDNRGGVYVDILPLDPRNASWAVGYDGLDWAAYTTSRRASEIEAQYGVSLGGSATTPYEVIDYYDGQFNAVIVKGYGFVKDPTPHGAVGVPIDIVPVGNAPEIRGPLTTTTGSGYGESIYAENRGVYENMNYVLSIYLSLVNKARDRSYVLYSPDGTATLQDNPNSAAGVLSLPSTAKLELVALSETTKDAAILSQVVSEEMHFGSLSKTSYGDIPFQLSGFAINSLRQSVFSILQPIVSAVQDAYTLALNGLCDQYMTGKYPTMQLSGHDTNRVYFSQETTPQELSGVPSVTVTMEPDLPQDEVGNIAMAVQARTPDAHGVPLLPDVAILEKIVKVQDVAATTDAIKEQQAERGSPAALALTFMTAAENQGREDLAGLWFSEFMLQRLQQMFQLTLAKMQEEQVGIPGSPGLSNDVLPGAAQGKAPPTPTPQGGANVPPESPRPGAQSIPPVIRAWSQ